MVAARPVAESAGFHDAALVQPSTVFVVDPEPRHRQYGQRTAPRVPFDGSDLPIGAGLLRGLRERPTRMPGLGTTDFRHQRPSDPAAAGQAESAVAHGLRDCGDRYLDRRGSHARGAIHVLEKPLRFIELLNAIQEALAIDHNERRKEARKRWVVESIAILTRKERQLLSLVASVKSTKAIASELNVCPRSVEVWRRGVMGKLGLKSSLELFRFALLAGQECSHSHDTAELQTATRQVTG